MGNEASSDYCGYRVLSVQPNSPGEEAGLDPYFDFVVAANNVQTKNINSRCALNDSSL